MKALGLVFAFILCVCSACSTSTPAPVTANGNWYFEVISPNGGAIANIGPYNDILGCNDWQGSACYLHPNTCQDDPTTFNCRIIGDGFAYPKGWAYPPTGKPGTGLGSLITPCGACYTPKNAPTGSKTLSVNTGQYGLVYPSTGGVKLETCGNYDKAAQMKGSRCFYVGQNAD